VSLPVSRSHRHPENLGSHLGYRSFCGPEAQAKIEFAFEVTLLNPFPELLPTMPYRVPEHVLHRDIFALAQASLPLQCVDFVGISGLSMRGAAF
jgi:hypothetical protein